MCIINYHLYMFVPCRHKHAVLANIDWCVPGSIHPNDRCPNSVPAAVSRTVVPNIRCRVCHPIIQNQAGAVQANNPIPHNMAGAVPVNNPNPPIMAAAQAANNNNNNNNNNNANNGESSGESADPQSPYNLNNVLDGILNDPANDPANDVNQVPINNPLPGHIGDALVAALSELPSVPYPYEAAIQEVLASIADVNGDDFDFSIDLPEPDHVDEVEAEVDIIEEVEEADNADNMENANSPEPAGESPNNAASPHNSLLDAEGETDPEYAPGGCHYVDPNGHSEGSDANTPVQQDNSSPSPSSSPSSSSSEDKDEGSLYEDSGRDESAGPETERAITRSLMLAALSNAAPAASVARVPTPTPPRDDGDSDDSGDADDEASHASRDIYEATP